MPARVAESGDITLRFVLALADKRRTTLHFPPRDDRHAQPPQPPPRRRRWLILARARRRAADGRARRDDREHRPAVRAGGAGLLRRQPPVDRHRLRARLRQPAAARRAPRRPLRPQARPSSSACSASPSRRRSAAPPRASACSSAPARCRARSARCSPPPRSSLLTTTFTDPRERGKAFGIFGAIAGGGGAIGLLLGGVLTEYLDWRWCLYVNLLFADPGRARRAARCCTTVARRAPPAPRHPRHAHRLGRPVRARLRLLATPRRTAGATR